MKQTGLPYNPLVSVIIPNYNHAQWVGKRIDTVLAQTYANIELIILDDASSDNSREILEAYRGHPKVQSIEYNDSNSGSAFRQWHKGLQKAKGELIWIAESDDFSHPELLQHLVPAFANSKCVLAHCEVVFVDVAGQVIFSKPRKEAQWFEGRQFIVDNMTIYDSLVNAGMVLFRRSALERTSLNFLDYKLSGDYRLFCEIILQGDVYASGEPHAFFRKHHNELTTRFLNTMVYHGEHIHVVDWLIGQQAVPPIYIKKIAKEELKALFCTRGNYKAGEFEEQLAFWKSTCKRFGWQPPVAQAWTLAAIMKGRHRLGKLRGT